MDILDNGKPESPGLAPPIPNRSHYRVQSQQNNGIRKPNITPLITGNERNRSQSEGASSATIRQKRGGLVINSVSELGTVDEGKGRRLSHLRGWSQGSGLSGTTLSNGKTSNESSEGQSQRSMVSLNRPLSDLLEHKRRSRAPDIAVEASKNILFAMSQLKDPILNLIRAVGSDTPKGLDHGKDDIFGKFVVAFSELRDLGQHLRKFDTLAEEDEEEADRLSLAIRKTASRSLLGFISLMTLMMYNSKEILRDGDVRFVRTFLLLQQGSIIEIRNACSVMGLDFKKHPRSAKQIEKPGNEGFKVPANRVNGQRKQSGSSQMNQNLRQPGLAPRPDYHRSRSNDAGHREINSAATPYSGESFSTLGPINISQTSMEYDEEEAKFERVYLKLRSACASIENMSFIRDSFVQARSIAQREFHQSDARIKILNALIHKAEEFLMHTQALSESLQQIKLRDPLVRNNLAFWQQCYVHSKVRSPSISSELLLIQTGLV